MELQGYRLQIEALLKRNKYLKSVLKNLENFKKGSVMEFSLSDLQPCKLQS